MSALVAGLDGWQLGAQADRRFRRTMAWVGMPALALALVLPQLDMPHSLRDDERFTVPRYVELMPALQPPPPVEPAMPPPPASVAPVQALPPPPPPASTEAQQQSQARDRAQRSGLLAMKERLAQLQAHRSPAMDLLRPLQGDSASVTADSGSRTDFAQVAAADSGGIGRASHADTPRGRQGTELGLHRTAAVERPHSLAPNPARRSAGEGRSVEPGRTLEEIQLAFDRNKGAFHAIFNRAMRDNPNLGAGKIVVSLTIAPSGAVIDCTLVSSTFNDPDLERKVIQRVMLLDFGGKAVPEFIYPDYPINFLPS